MQGWRLTMEDSHVCVLSIPSMPNWSFHGIFDGHRGTSVANYLSQNLMNNIFEKQTSLIKHGEVTTAVRQGFIATDQAISKKGQVAGMGSTANVVIINYDRIYCANTGDSRSVASIRGHATPLSFDHKPDNAEELRRIESTEGWVKYNRVFGELAVSRAFGDFEFKSNYDRAIQNQTVTCFPDISIKENQPEIEFIIMACDGIWEVRGNQEVVDFIRNELSKKVSPDQVLKDLFMDCVAKSTKHGLEGFDNMTAILICFLHSKPYNFFVSQVHKPKTNDIDPHMFMMHLENGIYRSNEIMVRSQRHWGYPAVMRAQLPEPKDWTKVSSPATMKKSSLEKKSSKENEKSKEQKKFVRSKTDSPHNS